MNEEKRKQTTRILILVIVLLGVTILFLFASLTRQRRVQAAADTIGEETVLATAGAQQRPDETSDLEDVSISLNDYRVFTFDDLDFSFIIANLEVDGEAPLNLPLSHFTTSEGIVLDETEDYVAALEARDYYLGRQNVNFSLVSQETPFAVNIFIPVRDKSASKITLTNDMNDTVLTFSMTPATGTKDMLAYSSGDVITDGKTYEMTVSQAREITGEPLYETVDGQDQDYLLASTTKVYAFEVEAVSLWGDTIVLEAAEYVPDNSSQTFTALESTIHSMKYSNILGREITDQDHGYLFFYAYDPQDHPITYTGVLKLKIAGSENWITVNVDLN